NIADGTVALGGPALIGDTIKNTTISSSNYKDYQYVSGPIVNGTGNNGVISGTTISDGWIANSDGYNPIDHQQIAFNALLQMSRPAVTLVNGTIYLGWASHGDDGPYYGWLMAYRATDLALVGAFVTAPTFKGIVGDRPDFTAQDGIWMSGNRFA